MAAHSAHDGQKWKMQVTVFGFDLQKSWWTSPVKSKCCVLLICWCLWNCCIDGAGAGYQPMMPSSLSSSAQPSAIYGVNNSMQASEFIFVCRW